MADVLEQAMNKKYSKTPGVRPNSQIKTFGGSGGEPNTTGELKTTPHNSLGFSKSKSKK